MFYYQETRVEVDGGFHWAKHVFDSRYPNTMAKGDDD
jgi:hypothetical protein